MAADEPYYLLEEEGYEFGFPPSLEDYRALPACSVQILTSPSDAVLAALDHARRQLPAG